MRIIGIDNMTVGELVQEVDRGGRFVVFQYTISIIVLTFTNPTDIHFVRSGEGTFGRSFGPNLVSFFLGWWGFPFGFIFTIQSLFVNLNGGRDVTGDVMRALVADLREQMPEAQQPWARGRSG